MVLWVVSQHFQYSSYFRDTCSNHVCDLLYSKGFGWCLDDEPSNHKYEYSTVLPGVIYDLDQQCKMRHGPSSGVCHVQWVCNEKQLTF